MNRLSLVRLASAILFWSVSFASAPAAEMLNLFCWSEYIPRTVIDAFEKQSGVHVTVENYASNEEMLAKLLGAGAVTTSSSPANTPLRR